MASKVQSRARMMIKLGWVLLAVATTAGAGACKKKADEPAQGAKPAAREPAKTGTPAVANPAGGEAAKEAAPAPPSRPAGPRGLAATDNDPKLVEVARGVTDCALDPMYPKNACRDDVKAFVAGFDAKNPAHVGTVVNLLDDPTPQVRVLGLAVMSDLMLMQQAPARALASRVTAAAAAETDATAAGLYGEVLLQGDFQTPAYADAIAAMVERHPVPQLRASLVSNLAVQDPARFVPMLQARFAAESDKDVKLAILGAFYGVGADQAAKVCPWLLERVADPDNDLAGAAAYDLVWSSGACSDHYDGFIAAYAKRNATTKADFQFVLKTTYMAQAKGATDAQKQAFLDASKVIVEDTAVSGMARASALTAIGKHHPDGKAYAKRFVGDANASVADAAKAASK